VAVAVAVAVAVREALPTVLAAGVQGAFDSGGKPFFGDRWAIVVEGVRPGVRGLGRFWCVNDHHSRRWDVDIDYRWRGDLDDEELYSLARSCGGQPSIGWWDRIRPQSFGWITARPRDGSLVGFVNVAWDGCDHAFLLDPKVRPDHQHAGVGTELVRRAAAHARESSCEWLHVDFADDLAPFYLDACGFQPTQAGLIHLPDTDEDG
jgi:ribosomal protein S18 acetylase RimI-like enzyme